MVRALSVGILVALLAATARADIITGGDFESGATPTGFTTYGNTAVVSSVGGGPSVFPGGGLFFVEASNGSGAVSAGTGGASFFTGDPAGTGNNITEYSGFSFSLSVPVTSLLTFMVNVQTGEVSGGVPDIVAVYIDDGGGAVPFVGAVIDDGGTLTAPFGDIAGGDFDGNGISDGTFGTFSDGQTGWDTVGGPIGPGSYTVYFLVGDVGDSVVDTGLAIDNISLAPVPEPGTWLLFGAGALGLAGLRRFRSRKKA